MPNWVASRRSVGFDDTLHLSVHTSGYHVPHHFVVRDERPKRVFESCGFVLFYDEMRKPCERISHDERERKIVPSTAVDKPYDQDESQGRTDKMQDPRQRL